MRRATLGWRGGWRARTALSSSAHTSCLMKAPIVRWGENTRTVSYKARAFDHRGMYLKVNAPTKHTDTPSPRPARPDLYNVLITACRCPRPRAPCVLPDSLVSRVSQPPALGRLDRRRAHRAQSRGGRASLWSACIPPLPPSLPTGCYMLLPLGSYKAPASLTCLTRPHGLTAGRALGSSGVDLASCMLAPRTLGESWRAPLSLPCVHPESTLSRGSACRAQAPF